MKEPEDNFAKFWARVQKDWRENPPRLLGTFGRHETEQAAIKIIDNCDENGVFDENIFIDRDEISGFYDFKLSDGWIEPRDDDKWFVTEKFWDRIGEKY